MYFLHDDPKDIQLLIDMNMFIGFSSHPKSAVVSSRHYILLVSGVSIEYDKRRTGSTIEKLKSRYMYGQ